MRERKAWSMKKVSVDGTFAGTWSAVRAILGPKGRMLALLMLRVWRSAGMLMSKT